MKRKTDNFNKFFNKKNNAAIKEEFRQEKKAAKKERKEAIERHFEEKRRARYQQQEPGAGERPGFKGRPGSRNAAPGAAGKFTPAPAGKAAPGAGAPGSSAHNDADLIPLNKYIAHGGICSRRDAAELIRLGKIEVNGQIVTEPGTKVSPDDLVKASGKKVTISRNFVYILLNKPKDYITTNEDPQGRKTVLDLIRKATTERVYPVGRLDRNTSGVLLLTNDGDLAQKLAHPKHEIKKIYHVTLDKPLTKADFDKIIAGNVVLEDGPAIVDVIAYADARDKAQVGLEIHSGRNRIVRRIFEHLGYDVRGLDRVTYAGLTKKNVQRGKWRLLTEKEIRILKYLNASFKGSPEKGAKAQLRDQQAQAAKNGGVANPAKQDIGDDEGWQDPADIDWENAPASAWDAKSQPNAAANRNAKKDINRYTKAQEARKLPGKKKPPTLTLKAEEEDGNDITAADQAFADRKGYSGQKLFNKGKDRRPSGKSSFGGGDKPPFRGKKSFGSDKPAPRGKSYGVKKSFGADKSFGSDKPAFGGGDKPPFRGKKSFGSDKPAPRGRSFDGDKSFDSGKPAPRGKSYGGKKSFGSDRPSGSDKPAARGKSFSSGRKSGPGAGPARKSGPAGSTARKSGPSSGPARKSSRPGKGRNTR